MSRRAHNGYGRYSVSTSAANDAQSGSRAPNANRRTLQRDVSTMELMQSVSGPTQQSLRSGNSRLGGIEETSFTSSGRHDYRGPKSLPMSPAGNHSTASLADIHDSHDQSLAVRGPGAADGLVMPQRGRSMSVTSIMSVSDVARMTNKDLVIHQASRDGKMDVLLAVLMDGAADHADCLNCLDMHSYAPLHHAARYGYVNVISLLVQHGAVVDIRGDEGRTPLYLASKYNHSAAVDALLDSGANLLLSDVYGLLPVHVAARRGHCQAVECLLAEGDRYINECDHNGMSALHHCCTSGSLATTQILLKHTVDIMSRNVNQETPFHLAALEGHEAVLKLITDHVSSVRNMSVETLMLTADTEGNACLHLAALNGHVKVITLCLDTLENINVQNSHGSTALHLASLNGHIDAVKLLCERGANIHMADADLMTPLLRATMFDRQEIVAYFLEKDKELLQVRDKNGYTPMLLAASRGFSELIGQFHRHQGDIMAKDSREATCLHMAVEHGSVGTVECLVVLSGKRLINEVDRDEASALHLAAQNGHTKLCELLVDNGADLTMKDEHERLALHWAARNGHLDTSRYLAGKAPTYVNANDDQARTPLHLSAIHSHHHLVKMLLATGADVTAKDCGRWTPLCHAARQGCVLAMTCLLDHGSPVNMVDNSKNTALILASGAGHVAAVNLLLAHGADVGHTNSNRMNCLDIAIHYNEPDVALSLLRHYRWREMMDSREFDGNTPMKRLVERMPKVAEFVLDRSVKTSVGPPEKGGVKVVYDFRYVSEDPSGFEDQALGMDNEPFQAMEIMVENGTETLLAHPLSQALLQSKWESFGKVLFVINMLLYIAFVVSLTYYALTTELPNSQANMNTNNAKFVEERGLHYRAIEQTHCSTSHGEVNLVTLSGHLRNTSIVYGIHPCNHTLFSHLVTCLIANKHTEMVFSPFATARLACPSGNSSYLLACPVLSSPTTGPASTGLVATTTAATTSYNVYEEDKPGPTSSCAHHAYNSTCQLDPQQLGVIYSSAAIPEVDAVCTSPYLLESPPNGSLFVKVVVIVFACIHIIKELVYLLALKLEYFRAETIMDWCVYSLSLVFVWPGLYGSQPNGVQWRCGAIALCLAWINLLAYVRRFNEVGIYVVMFVSVLKTVIKVFLVYCIVLIGFSLCFYILFSGHDNFTTPGISILQIGVMMLGEVEFVEIFITNRQSIEYKDVSYAVYAVYIIIVPIVLMNLLVGLAVDDIDVIKKTAHLKRLAMQVHMISSIEYRVPFWYRQHVYRSTLVTYPHERRTKLQMVLGYMGHLINMQPGTESEEFESEADKSDAAATVHLLTKQGKRLENLEDTLREQNQLLHSMAERLKLGTLPRDDAPETRRRTVEHILTSVGDEDWE